MMALDHLAKLPVDWNDWRKDWHSWRASTPGLISTIRPEGYPKDKNFLADEVLGWFRCPNGIVELSEVVFRIYEPERYIGYAFSPHLEGETGVVCTFHQLEQVLGLAGGGDDDTA